MHVAKKSVAALLFVMLVIVLLALPQHAATPEATPQAQGAQGQQPAPGIDMSLPSESIPAYHKQPPTGTLPAILDPQLFANMIAQNAYTVAARVKKILYQEPCYCHCDQSQGHGSLQDCFAGKHGSVCNVCMGEDFYTYEQTRKGKTPAQIRAGIIQGDWKSVDLSKYQVPLPVTEK
jgi:hypothetical protein